MKKGNLNRNKGFSLIELIIVIAIAAILVAIMVPVLIKYIEKSNVSSDTQLADTVRSAFLCAVTDAKVLSDPDSAPYIADLESATGMDADDNSFSVSHCVMHDSVEEIIGMSVTQLNSKIKSKHDPNAKFHVNLVNGNIIVTITGTDRTGKKDTSSSTPNNDIVVD